jgi:hypothetical protein
LDIHQAARIVREVQQSARPGISFSSVEMASNVNSDPELV